MGRYLVYTSQGGVDVGRSDEETRRTLLSRKDEEVFEIEFGGDMKNFDSQLRIWKLSQGAEGVMALESESESTRFWGLVAQAGSGTAPPLSQAARMALEALLPLRAVLEQVRTTGESPNPTPYGQDEATRVASNTLFRWLATPEQRSLEAMATGRFR